MSSNAHCYSISICASILLLQLMVEKLVSAAISAEAISVRRALRVHVSVNCSNFVL